MAFCIKCGNPLPEGAIFCGSCGAKVLSDGPSQETSIDPVAQAPAVNAVAEAASTAAVNPDDERFRNITVRYCCPNGHVFDGTPQNTTCPTCNAPLPKGGYIQLYRMGNYIGCAVGMGVYVDDKPCGHIGNTQSIRIAVPYGEHKIHVTHTTTRKCNDPVYSVTPEKPYVWCKARFVKAGFAIEVAEASKEDMPT